MKRMTILALSAALLAVAETSCHKAQPVERCEDPWLPGGDLFGDETITLDFGMVFLKETVRKSIDFINPGCAPYTIDDVHSTPDLDLDEFFFNFDGPITVQPQGSALDTVMPFAVTLAATTVGEKMGVLTFSLRSVEQHEFRVYVRARVVDPMCAIAFEPSTTLETGEEALDFGKAVIDYSTKRALTVTNGSTYDWDLILGDIDNGVDQPMGSSAGFSYHPSSAHYVNQPVEIKAGKSLYPEFNFMPQRPGPYEGTLAVIFPRACQPAPVQMVGVGMDDVLVCGATLDFGFVARSSEVVAKVTCRNEGTSPINMTLGAIVQPPSATANPDYRPFTIVNDDDRVEHVLTPGGDPWEIEVSFIPLELGQHDGNIPFTSNDQKRKSGKINLVGIGGGPKIDVQNTLDMGTIATYTTKKRDLTIKNGGNDVAGTDEDRLRFVAEVDGISRVTPPVIYDAVEDIDSPYFKLMLNASGGVFPDGFGPELGLAEADTVTLRLSYTAPMAGDHFGRLVIFTNDPATPIKTVTLKGTAIVREPCAAVYNNPIDFGTVEKNQRLTLALTILNDRDPDDPSIASDPQRYACEVSGMKLVENTDNAFRFEDANDGMFPDELSITLLPGARMVVPIGFAPIRDGSHSGGVTFYISDTVNSNPVVALRGLAGQSCLEALPKTIQFGTIKTGCQSKERGTTLRNGCSYPIHLVGVPTISAIGDAPFNAVNPLSANTQLAANAQFDMNIRYRPVAVGMDEGALSLVWTDGSVQRTTIVALEGASTDAALSTETFSIPSTTTVDTLFVIENSAMYDRRAALASNFDSFIRVAAVDQVDFHIAVTTTDARIEQGRFVPVSGTQAQRILTPALGPAALKTQFMSNVIGMGDDGSATESLIWPAYMALRNPLLSGANAGFLRQSARLSIVIVSEAEDMDPYNNPITLYDRFFRTIKGGDTLNGLRFSAIIPTLMDAPSNCAYDSTYAGRSPRVKDLAASLNGTVDEICQSGWSQTLLAMSKYVFGPTLVFHLINEADPATVKVYIDGQPIDEVNTNPPYGPIWSYDSARSAVVFQETTAPAPGQTLVIEYGSACIAP